MKFVRWFLGRIILGVSFLTKPKGLVRAPLEQQAVDAATAKMSLYQLEACPFCVKIRRELTRLSLNIELRDAKNNAAFKDELIREGGKHKVPCLRIEDDAKDVKWLYESKDIAAFLQAQFRPA